MTAADIFLDVLLHSGFLVAELLLMIWALGERVILGHPMTKVVGSTSQPVQPPYWLLPVAAGVLLATLAASYFLARAFKLAWAPQVRESALLTLCVAAIHLGFTMLIAEQYFPAALTGST